MIIIIIIEQEDKTLCLLIRRTEGLKDEIAKVWHMRKVIVVPVVIGALGAISVNFKEYMKRIGVNVKLEVIQKTALLGTAKILKESTVPVRRRKRETWDPW